MHVIVCCYFGLFISINNVQFCALLVIFPSLSIALCLGQLQGCFSSDSNVVKHEIAQKILRNILHICV